eukprot:6317045-Pyramimonas_sp.AAC.1
MCIRDSPRSAVQQKSSTRCPAVVWLTAYRRFPVDKLEEYLVELEEFRRGVELVPRRALRHR